MVALADVEALRDLTDGAVLAGGDDVAELVRQIMGATGGGGEARDALVDYYPRLLASAEDDAATLAAAYWEDVYRTAPELAPPSPLRVGEAAVDHSARLLWTPDGSGLAEDALQRMGAELVRKTDRYLRQMVGRTMAVSASRNRLMYARVPSRTGKSCAFCLMLASRGADYRSQFSGSETAGNERFHDHCRCAVVAVNDPSELPDGYDPDALYQDVYVPALKRAKERAGGRRPTPSEIMAAMRETSPGMVRDAHAH